MNPSHGLEPFDGKVSSLNLNDPNIIHESAHYNN